MQITSIDNCCEDDGLALVYSFLAGLNQEPVGPMKRVLIAVLPEYDTSVPDAPRLLRLDFVTAPACDPGLASADELALAGAAAAIVAALQAKRAAALKALAAKPPITVQPIGS